MSEAVPDGPLVLDASVALKWLLPFDEPGCDIALQVLKDYQDALIDLVAPRCIAYEVGHGLRSAVRRERLSFERATGLLERFIALDIETWDDKMATRIAWTAAEDFDCGFYDACYVGISAVLRTPLLHADGKLRARLDGRHEYQLWLADYPIYRVSRLT